MSNFLEDTDLIFNQRLSYKKKKAHDFKWAEECADYVDLMQSTKDKTKRNERLKMNYDLYNGHGQSAMEHFSDEFSYELAEEGITSDLEGIKHYPIQDQVAKSMVGEQQRRKLKPVAVDVSKYSSNMRKKKRLELIQEKIQETVLNPLNKEVTMEYMRKNQIEDVYSLSPEEQQQMQQEINQEVADRSPEDIDMYMSNKYKSPPEVQAQKITDWLVSEYDLKYLTDEGMKHAIITGDEVYYIGVRHNKPYIELVDPMGFYHRGRKNAHFIEESELAKYEQYVMFSDIYNWYGDEIGRKKKYKETLERWASGYVDTEEQNGRFLGSYDNHKKLLEVGDIRTKEGQNDMANLRSGYHNNWRKGGDIRHVHCTWKSLRKLKYITRLVNEKEETYWVDESYTFNPLKGDIKEDVAWVNEVWECTKIGSTTDAIYLNKRPVPYQYKSLKNPWDVKLPYIGAEYSKLMGNTARTSPMDLGKPWQYKFNMQMAKIEEMEQTDMGKILLYSMNAKPKDWSWGKFLKMIKYGKIAPINLQQEGVNPIDAQVFKSIDMSNMQDLAGKLQYLEFLKNQVAISMSYNPSRLGAMQPYMSVGNNQQNIVQSTYQTEDIYTTHNKVIEIY